MESDFQQGQAGSPRLTTESDILAELKQLAHSPGFIYALAYVAAATSFARPEFAKGSYEALSVKELTLVVGLVAMHTPASTAVPSETMLTFQIERLYALLQQLHDVVARPMTDGFASRVDAAMSTDAHKQADVSIPPSGPEMVEPIFYVGTGAYDFQYLDLASEKYRYDTDWLTSRVGLSVGLLVRVARELQHLRESRFHAFMQTATYQASCRAALHTFSFTREDLGFLTDDEFNAFIDRFAVTPGKVRHNLYSVGDMNVLEFKPIMKLGEHQFFMLVGFKLAQAIYESPFFWMASDQHYSERAFSNRGRTTEEMAVRLLSPVFKDKVYKNVTIRSGGQIVHEMDALAIVGDQAIVFQAKAKRLTVPSRQGDEEQLQKDFSQAIQDAYQQGLASRRFLLDHEHQILDSEGNPIRLPVGISEVYVVCLTLDHFPALPFMSSMYLKKGPEDPFPVTMSMFDLDILTTYLKDPFEFLHYIYQRSRWSDQIYGSCEIAYLAWYLKQGLALPKDVSGMSISESMAALIDDDFPAIRGRNVLLARLLGIDAGSGASVSNLRNRWQDSDLMPISNLLKSANWPGSIEALFLIYDLSEEAVDFLLQQIATVRRKCQLSQQDQYLSVQLEHGGISYVCFWKPSARMRTLFEGLTSACKYKAKADRWLGLGAVLTSPTIAEAVWFNREPWTRDAELEDLVASLS